MSSDNDEEETPAWYDFTQDATMHGIRYVFLKNTSVLRRIVWLLMILGSLAYFSYAASGFVQDFAEKKLNTKIRVAKTSSLQFPTITICNKNLWTNSYMEWTARGLNTNGLNEIFKDLFEMYKPVPPPADKYNWSDATYSPIYDFTPEATNDFLKQAAHPLDASFGYCVVHGKPVHCTDVLEVVGTDGGYCFQFNSNGTVNATAAGVSGGISFMLYANVDEYFTGPNSYSEGFTLTFHNHYEVPMVTELSVGITPGTQASVLLHKAETRRYPPPADNKRSNCFDTEKLTNPLHYYGRYSYSACQLECKTTYVLKKCGCRDPMQPPLNDSVLCLLPRMLYCSNPALKSFTTDPEGLVACNCPDPCLDSEYIAKISINSFPNERYASNAGMDDQMVIWMKRNAIILDIYFGKMSYQILEEELAYSIFDMIANTGGTLGLCVGASILTLWEALEFGVLALFKSICSRRQKQGSKASIIKVAPANFVTHDGKH